MLGYIAGILIGDDEARMRFCQSEFGGYCRFNRLVRFSAFLEFFLAILQSRSNQSQAESLWKALELDWPDHNQDRFRGRVQE